MSARRQVLEDSSDESESGDVGSSSSSNDAFKFLSEEQLSEIEACNIKSDGDGTYSADAMDLAISQNEANLFPLEDDQCAHKYQGYQVMKDKVDDFLSKPIWNRSGEPSEEVLLLEIEALRRSSKKTKINMFKHNSKTGGQVMFGPWWNYTLQRIVQISSNNTTEDAMDWESYTAGRILLSLFAFVTESTDVVKKGKLADLKSAFGVDWDNNVKTARKVISRYAENSILDEECTKCELHVDGLRGALPSNDTKKEAVPSSISLKPTHADAGDKKLQDEEEKKKREDEARKKRMAAMKANQRRASAFSVSQTQAKTEIVLPSTAVNPPAGVSRIVTDPPRQTSVPQNDSAGQMKPPPARFIPPVRQPTTSSDPRAQQLHTTTSASTPYNTAQSETKIETAANPNSSFASQNDYSYGQSYETKQSASQNIFRPKSSSNDGMRPQGPRDDDANTRPNRSQHDSREDRNNRYNDRSADYDSRKRDARYEQSSYSRGDSRDHSTSRGYGRGRDYDDERPNKRSRGPNDTMNYSSSAPSVGGTERWQPKQESTTSKYDDTRPPARTPAFTAPSASAGRGRGRGGVDNRPAWMTKGENALNGSTPSAPIGGQQPSADPGAKFTAPVASAGRGRGRGGVDNRPAWMTQGQNGPGNLKVPASVVDTQKSSTVSSEQPAFSAPPMGVGRGRGRGGVDNRPAWMTKAQTAQSNETAPKPAGSAPSTAPSGRAAFASQAAVGGMGRGRGRGRGRGIDNRPAWMSKQESQQNN